jgi:hypothetical protein
MRIKHFLTILISFILLGTLLHGETKRVKETSVASLVTQVKKAPSSQRRVLMNQLKIKLRSMSKENRRQVMMDLRHTFNSQNHTKHMKEMQSSMQQQSASMMMSSQSMTDAMNSTSMTHTGMSAGGAPRSMHPSQFKSMGK